MLQRESFKKLRVYATNQGFTPDQIRNASWSDVETHLDLTPNESAQFWHFRKGMQEILLRDALKREQTERLILLRSQLNSVYPDADLSSETVEDLAIQLLPYLYGEA